MRKKRNFFCFKKNKNFSENLFSDFNFILKNTKTLIQKKLIRMIKVPWNFIKIFPILRNCCV